jgi:hypothetical protein
VKASELSSAFLPPERRAWRLMPLYAHGPCRRVGMVGDPLNSFRRLRIRAASARVGRLLGAVSERWHCARRGHAGREWRVRRGAEGERPALGAGAAARRVVGAREDRRWYFGFRPHSARAALARPLWVAIDFGTASRDPGAHARSGWFGSPGLDAGSSAGSSPRRRTPGSSSAIFHGIRGGTRGRASFAERWGSSAGCFRRRVHRRHNAAFDRGSHGRCCGRGG